MKKAIFVISLFLFIVIVNHQLVNAQDFHSLGMKSKPSLNGLEVSNYKEVLIKIEMQGSGVDKISLTEERVRTKCELRLRQAGLKPIPTTQLWQTFVISVQVLPNSFSIGLKFSRGVLFDVSGTTYFVIAQTWEHSGTGSHGSDPEYIIQKLDQNIDVFINEYLKANVK